MKNFQQYLEAIKNKVTESRYSCKDGECKFWIEYQNKYKFNFSIAKNDDEIENADVIKEINNLNLDKSLKERIINTIKNYGGWKSYFTK